MLFDLEELLEKPRNQDVEASDFRSVASRMLRQQTLYRDDWNSKSTYEFILRFRGYFTDLFDAVGLDLVITERDLTIALTPKQSLARKRLSLDETVLLLLLRAAFEQGVAAFEIGDHGEVTITSMELLERYEAITGRPRPAWPRVREILKECRRRAFIALGEEFPDESGVEITVRPSIRDVTGEGYLARIDEFLASGAGAQGDGVMAESTEDADPGKDSPADREDDAASAEVRP